MNIIGKDILHCRLHDINKNEHELTFYKEILAVCRTHNSPYSHSCLEISFFDINCRGVVEIEDKTYNFSAGDIVIVEPHLSHSEVHESNGNLIFIGLECDSFYMKSGVYHNLWHIKSILSNIFNESLEQQYKYNEMLAHYLRALLITVERIQPPVVSSTKNLSYVKNYIEENCMHEINIFELAKSSGYSYDHFRHLFKQSFGISPKNFLLDSRCRHALSLLQSTELSCTQIAYQRGFSNSSQMSKMFQKKYNISPSSVKKKIK